MERLSRQLAEARQDLERARTRLRILSEASGALASVLDADEAMRRMARLLVPAIGGVCLVDLLGEGTVRRVAFVHQDPLLSESAQEHVTAPWPDESAAPLAKVLRGAGPLAVENITADHQIALSSTSQHAFFRTLGAARGLIVPLRARHTVLGALTLIRPAAADPFDQEDTSWAADLGHRAGLALENARLYALQQHTAEQLQRSLLPDLGGLQHLELAARYVPARQGAEVGGDWYDGFRLVDGSTALAIGDVVGHDLTAAVRMGQLRNMLRALAYDSGDSPAGVMQRLDHAMQGLSTTELVTAVVVRLYAPATGPWIAHWSNAGHPPPLLCVPGEASRLLEAGLSPVLGVDPAFTRDDATIVLPPGSTLLLYTDGLIERPGEDITRGLARLRQHGAGLAGLPIQRFCDALLERVTGGHFDDIAILALRVPQDFRTGHKPEAI
ncbi:PP2C family protein-serine/threonine phosphatase [Actinacidiphila epipremni]|uniref:SpoIIE family protein phosphatase n=1 Tax=Actinacidiphila epipremni TaxID=2053013 RepID=A0ABX0ZZ57_9ACTN|nr:GAF domain-containing SpoIIE family protein phosphatase [Actinacidiphila epipremni]NJP48240.1 SpoIIE family protein phosphatase [Actinacidiphila epipremni]